MGPDARIISIGALPAHPLRGERWGSPVRPGHATTVLIRSAKAVILVDPSLPAQALLPRLHERVGLGPRDITHVFLTSFRPDTRRAIEAFDQAEWWIHEAEREAVGAPMALQLRSAAEAGDHELAHALEHEVAILRRCSPAPDKPAQHVSLFPLPGFTPGLCGLLLEEPRHTTVICGDAIPTIEHLEAGTTLPGGADVELAKRSFQDAIEVADLLILGRDNLVVNPTKRPF